MRVSSPLLHGQPLCVPHMCLQAPKRATAAAAGAAAERLCPGNGGCQGGLAPGCQPAVLLRQRSRCAAHAAVCEGTCRSRAAAWLRLGTFLAAAGHCTRCYRNCSLLQGCLTPGSLQLEPLALQLCVWPEAMAMEGFVAACPAAQVVGQRRHSKLGAQRALLQRAHKRSDLQRSRKTVRRVCKGPQSSKSAAAKAAPQFVLAKGTSIGTPHLLFTRPCKALYIQRPGQGSWRWVCLHTASCGPGTCEFLCSSLTGSVKAVEGAHACADSSGCSMPGGSASSSWSHAWMRRAWMPMQKTSWLASFLHFSKVPTMSDFRALSHPGSACPRILILCMNPTTEQVNNKTLGMTYAGGIGLLPQRI